MTARVYLDHAASAPLDPRVFEAMRPYLDCANPSALHASGRKAATALTEARERLAGYLSVARQNLTFTSGGTEANNLAVYGATAAHPGGHLLASPTEHPSVLAPLRRLAEQPAWELEWLPLDVWGQVTPEALSSALRPDTRLVAIQRVNNETGLIQPIELLGPICQSNGVLLLVDAAQAAAVLPLDPLDWQVDLMTLSGHKLHGPKGSGLLYCRSGLELSPLLLGGGQERGLRSGTENIAAAQGLAQAFDLLAEEREARLAHLGNLQNLLYESLAGCGQPVLPLEAPKAPQINSFMFPGARAQRLLMRLDLAGFEAGSGSACSLGNDEPSPVMKALGYSDAEAISVLRFSLGKDNRREEVTALVHCLKGLMEAS
ncbi:MAG: cysteine desulfurase family protein [bacterium]|nr:cysteine desulfurase family protein [bacterium]